MKRKYHQQQDASNPSRHSTKINLIKHSQVSTHQNKKYLFSTYLSSIYLLLIIIQKLQHMSEDLIIILIVIFFILLIIFSILCLFISLAVGIVVYCRRQRNQERSQLVERQGYQQSFQEPRKKNTLLQELLAYFDSRSTSQALNLFTPIGKKDKDRKRFAEIFLTYKRTNIYDPKSLQLKDQQSRAIGCMLGMGISDALGASTEFVPYKKEGYGYIINGFKDILNAIKNGLLRLRHGQVGIWTDDASMGIVMGYSLMLLDYVFDPITTRKMFHLWWHNGLGNGGRQRSIGLGGNISISMEEFAKNPNQKFADNGQQDNNGNGSLMRLAPIPIAFHYDIGKAGQAAIDQSSTTHNGLEAKQCAKLMTQIIVNLINRKQGQDGKEVLLRTCDKFESQVKEVVYLAKGLMQTEQMFNQSKRKYPNFSRWNKSTKDRNWNWRSDDFDYSPTRLKQHPGYIGSYCMDGLAMALHIVYHTNSFKQCAIKNADIGGDCDTVGSIAGQIAGALYGIDKEMLELYSEMQDFIKSRYELFLLGYKLFHHKKQTIYTDQQIAMQQQRKKQLPDSQCLQQKQPMAGRKGNSQKDYFVNRK